MNQSAIVLVGALLQACVGDDGSDATRAGASDLAADGQEATQGQGRGGNGEGGCDDTCARDARHDFRVWGQGLAAWEGRRVVAAAIENEVGGDQLLNRRVVLQSTSIRDGAFALACPRSLHDSYLYPSWAVFIDVDGDGRCTTGDLAYQMQLYAWRDDVEAELPATGWHAIPVSAVSGPIVLPVGSTASDFCSGYFD